jgi:hypothetical protein
MTSEKCATAFAERTSYHVGQSATCSKPHGGRAVLLGDAPAPFPAIGQGGQRRDGVRRCARRLSLPNLESTHATLPNGTRGMEAGVRRRYLDQRTGAVR